MPNLTRNTFILAKAEGSSYGVDSSPTASEAIRVISVDLNPITGDRVQRTNLQGYLGARKSMLARDHVAVTITFEMGGSGSAAVSPRFVPLLGACGLAGTTFSALTGAAQAGGTAGGNPTITLAAAGTSAVNDAYVGMPIRLTSGANSGKTGIIAAYNGTTKVATVYTNDGFAASAGNNYEISANTQYSPISQIDGVSNTSVTLYIVKDANLHKITGFRGNLQMSGELNGYPVVTVTGVGRYVAPGASTGITASFGSQAEPELFDFDGAGPLSFMNYNSACVSSFSLDYGNSVNFRALVNCTQQAVITDRGVTGSMTFENPNATTISFFEAARDNTGASDGQWIQQHGRTSGNRVIIYARRCGVNGDLSFSEMDGVEMLTVPVVIYPSSVGNDEILLTFA